MKFKLVLEGRVIDHASIVARLNFWHSVDAVILAEEVETEEFDLSRIVLMNSSDIRTATKLCPGVEGALTLSPSRRVSKSDFTKGSLKLVDAYYVGDKTVLVLDDDTYFSVLFRSLLNYGILKEVPLAGFNLRPYENIRVLTDGVVYLKETGHYCNLLFDS